MSTREKTLAVVLAVLIVVGGGGGLAYVFVIEPLAEKEKQTKALANEVDDLQDRMNKFAKDAPRLAVANKRSLPTDPSIASSEYYAMIERLIRQAYGGTIPPGLSITDKKITEMKAPTTPGQPAKKAPYTRVALEVEFKKADMWAVHDFLTGYYKLNLLQQITALSIKRDDENVAKKGPGATDRKDLTVKLTTEALILEGADPRRTLLPVSTGFAAVGGFPGYEAIALTPEASRGITPTQFVQILATKPRDYSLIVRKDPFHGLYIDPKAPEKKPDPDVAKVKVKEDISNSIYLSIVSTSSDRRARAVIRDSFNPQNYEIEADARGVKVAKFTFLKGKTKTPDPKHPSKDGLLVISDDNVSATNRTFKIVAVDKAGLILVDLTPAKSEEKTDGKADAKEPSAAEATPPRGGKGPGRTPSAAVAVLTPLAGAIGAAAAVGGPKGPRVYRWGAGKPLKALVELPADEAEKALQRASAEGPVQVLAASE